MNSKSTKRRRSDKKKPKTTHKNKTNLPKALIARCLVCKTNFCRVGLERINSHKSDHLQLTGLCSTCKAVVNNPLAGIESYQILPEPHCLGPKVLAACLACGQVVLSQLRRLSSFVIVNSDAQAICDICRAIKAYLIQAKLEPIRDFDEAFAIMPVLHSMLGFDEYIAFPTNFNEVYLRLLADVRGTSEASNLVNAHRAGSANLELPASHP
jgi:hypothetical protein